jgi:hypothetical protein
MSDAESAVDDERSMSDDGWVDERGFESRWPCSCNPGVPAGYAEVPYALERFGPCGWLM